MSDWDTSLTATKLEQQVLEFWQNNKIFEQVTQARKGAQPFVFYDGPPFANGRPHYGHILQMAIKDAVLRYKTMQGFRVPRKIGFDTHGLPVEYEVEKQLGLNGKKEIEAYGVEKFVSAARTSVMRYSSEWEDTMTRMGRWMDVSRPYKTMDASYIESVWWAFCELDRKGLLYEDYRVSPYCSRCGTVLSNFEVNLGYKDNIEDPSIYVAFPLIEQSRLTELAGARLLVWTTTPWTLASNAAVAVNPEILYSLVEYSGQRYLIGESRREELFGQTDPITQVYGSELDNLRYHPPYQPTDNSVDHKVILGGDEISTNEGTGLLHVAPAYGEFDFILAKKYGLQMLQNVRPDGTMAENLPGAGLFVKDADALIVKDLKERGLLYRQEKTHHTYPFCWRCDTPLLYYPTTSWFIKVTELKDKLVAENKEIKWNPDHLRDGRFGKWLEGARDWTVSRDRFWGAPLPVWKCMNSDHNDAKPAFISSIDELKKRARGNIPDDLHRPYIDNVILTCQCGGEMWRVPFVFDCWFESGAMPFAQFGYPHVNQDIFNPKIDLNYPAEFIAEAMDQTRGWFYTLHVLGVALFESKAFKAVDVSGFLAAPDGKKLSKKLRNYTEPVLLFDRDGADALRLFLFTTTTLGEDYRFSDEAIREGVRRWITPLLNVIKYYDQSIVDRDGVSESHPGHSQLDAWIKARVAQSRREVVNAMAGDTRHPPYDIVHACRSFGPLIEDLSTWYIRLSRGRTDLAFTSTLQEILIEIAITYAPFLPFVAEYVYQKVYRRQDEFPQSVHLCIFTPLEKWESAANLDEMIRVRKFVSLGRDARASLKINMRQPLATATINQKLEVWANYLVAQELNVKQVLTVQTGLDCTIEFDPNLSDELLAEGEANEIRRLIQDLRKQANLQPTDRCEVVVEPLPQLVKTCLEGQLKNTQLTSHPGPSVLTRAHHNSYSITLFGQHE